METISRLVLRHRRPLATLFAGLAVLLALGALRDELAETVYDAWLARAGKRAAAAWLAERELS